MCENAVNARVPVAVPGARGSSPLLKKVAGAVAATAALGAATAAYGHFIELNNFSAPHRVPAGVARREPRL